MVKKPHPPRNGVPSKKPTAAADVDNGQGPKTKKGTATPANSSKGGGKVGREEVIAPPEDVIKKPTTRELLAGSSWTGKLPLNLFSEHCQRAHWEKPEYTMRRTPEGFVSSVILRNKNPKTQEITELPPTRFPKSHEHLQPRETAVEARHFAATWALFRVASGKNLHMTLPPQFRDLWRGPFTDIKNDDVKAGQEWQYSPDPFQAYSQHLDDRAKAVKRREDAEKERAKQEEAKASGDLLAASGRDALRGWRTAPRMELGSKMRKEVERLVRREGVWNANDVEVPAPEQKAIATDLTKMGFRKSHCEEAMSICKDREEALEWLLVHVPEDDLPKWALPENYVAGVSMAGDPKREATIKRLTASGYPKESCEETLDTCHGSEVHAAGMLQTRLLRGGGDETVVRALSRVNLEITDAHEGDSPWNEEQEALMSIYEGRYSQESDDACSIKLETMVDGKEVVARLICGDNSYPQTLPILLITGSFPSHIKLALIRQALVFAAQELLGVSMIFSLIDWLEQNIQKISDNPGRLSDIAAASILSTDSNARYGRPTKKRKRQHPQPLCKNNAQSQSILASWQARQQIPAQQRMNSSRQTLPAWSKRDAIVAAVKSKQVVIISGATGSGKSTQSVQFILDDLIQHQLGGATRIICTQPRRISALGLADRVAEERCAMVGDEVGYAIRGESKQSANTKITFCTTGVLLRRMQTSGGSKDDLVNSIADISHIVVDEVHERSLDTDFLLALLRDVLRLRKDLKVILMSATLDAEIFEQYFGGPKKVGKVEVEGRIYPIDDYYLDDVVRMTGFRGDRDLEEQLNDASNDVPIPKAIQSVGIGINYQLIGALVRQIDCDLGSEPGAILIFLPGTMEINKTLEALRSISHLYALPLHASLLPAEQRRVFPPPPKGRRKVIASTNVAETSITIPDVVAIIDSGRVKETRYDPQSTIVKLVEVWASKAACQQRKGRAGRVRAGKAYKLFTRQAEAMKMPEKPEPEIRRTPLEQLCLSVKAMGAENVAKFLEGTITPPEHIAVQGALDLLKRMGALDDSELTALGQHMAMIPADLRCAKMMVLGALFGCLDATVTIASILTVKSPFVSPQDRRDEAKSTREAFGNGQSVGDLIISLWAYDEWIQLTENGVSHRDRRAWCERNFLSLQTLNDIASTRQQYFVSLQETGILGRNPRAEGELFFNRNDTSVPLLSSLVLAALSPQTIRILYPPTKYTSTSSGNLPLEPSAKSIQFFDEGNSRVFIHPSSTLFSAQGYPGNPGFMSYWQKVATSKVFARELCPAGTFAVLLFAGSGIEIDGLGRGVVVDGWIRIRGWARIGVLVGRLRSIVDAKLRNWFENPEDAQEPVKDDIVGLVKRLVELNGLDH